jgi:hypothetical protein
MLERAGRSIKETLKAAGWALKTDSGETDPEELARRVHQAERDYLAVSSQTPTLTKTELRKLSGR